MSSLFETRNSGTAGARALEARIAALEVQPKSLDYKGVWQRAADYQRNQGATHKGQLWICLMDARGVEPGTAPAYWQLAHKGAA